MKEQVVDWEGIEELRGGLERKVSRWSRDKSEVDDVVTGLPTKGRDHGQATRVPFEVRVVHPLLGGEATTKSGAGGSACPTGKTSAQSGACNIA